MPNEYFGIKYYLRSSPTNEFTGHKPKRHLGHLLYSSLRFALSLFWLGRAMMIRLALR
jgi:hypothetical protein